MLDEFRFHEADASAPFGAYVPAEDNPFLTECYAMAMRRRGLTPWLVLNSSGRAVALALLEKGRIDRRLNFPSLPAAASSPNFWIEISAFARREGVRSIVGGTFNSPAISMPPLTGETGRRARAEHVLDLRNGKPRLSSNHKRNAKRALVSGVTVLAQAGLVGFEEHVVMIESSLERREKRGEAVPTSALYREHRAMIESGAAALFQAVRDGQTLSSILIIRSPLTAYYHSAGTSPDGMKIGASHYLVLDLIERFRNEGLNNFNLGGAPEQSSLERFKVGFGTTKVLLESVTVGTGPAWLRALVSAKRQLLGR